MIRRKAVEAFRSLAPEGDTASNQSDATELPMSGLILALEQDIVGKVAIDWNENLLSRFRQPPGKPERGSQGSA
jgi:hypothetical protein